MDPKEKAKELVDRFGGNKELAMICTEEIIFALYDEGIRLPKYWHSVQEEINLL